MKRFLIIVFILSVTGFTGCNDNEEEVNPEALTVTKDQVTGKWLIANFTDGGKEIADQFDPPGHIEIFSNGDIFFPETTISGRWSLQDDNKEVVIIIDSSVEPYKQFEDDWAVIKVDDNNLWLIDDDALDEEEADDSSDADDDNSEEVRLRKVTDS